MSATRRKLGDERQYIVIGEDDDRPPPRLAREITPGRGPAGRRAARKTAPVGILEKAEPLLQA